MSTSADVAKSSEKHAPVLFPIHRIAVVQKKITMAQADIEKVYVVDPVFEAFMLRFINNVMYGTSLAVIQARLAWVKYFQAVLNKAKIELENGNIPCFMEVLMDTPEIRYDSDPKFDPKTKKITPKHGVFINNTVVDKNLVEIGKMARRYAYIKKTTESLRDVCIKDNIKVIAGILKIIDPMVTNDETTLDALKTKRKNADESSSVSDEKCSVVSDENSEAASTD